MKKLIILCLISFALLLPSGISSADPAEQYIATSTVETTPAPSIEPTPEPEPTPELDPASEPLTNETYMLGIGILTAFLSSVIIAISFSKMR